MLLLAALHSIIYLAGWRVERRWEVEVGGGNATGSAGSGALRHSRHIEARERKLIFLFTSQPFGHRLLL